MWNQKALPPPPTNTYKTTSQNLDLSKLRNALQEGQNHFKNQALLRAESAILARILYRMKMKFRSSRDFKLLEKLLHCLSNYFGNNLAKYLHNLLELVPKKYEKDTYLPAKNMLVYVLVKIQGLLKVMERAHDTCLLIAVELSKRLTIGHFWKLFVILYAIVSRLSVLIKFDTKYLCEFYGKLWPHCNKLEAIGENWLWPDYEPPSDIRQWLNVEWVYEEDFVDLTLDGKNEIVDFFNLVEDEEDEDDVLFCNEYILLDNDLANGCKKLLPLEATLKRNKLRGFSINEDEVDEQVVEVIELNDSTNVPDTEDVGEEIVELPEIVSEKVPKKEEEKSLNGPLKKKSRKQRKKEKRHNKRNKSQKTKILEAINELSKQVKVVTEQLEKTVKLKKKKKKNVEVVQQLVTNQIAKKRRCSDNVGPRKKRLKLDVENKRKAKKVKTRATWQQGRTRQNKPQMKKANPGLESGKNKRKIKKKKGKEG